MAQDQIDLDHIASMHRVLTEKVDRLISYILPVAYVHGSPRERHAIRAAYPDFKPGPARLDIRGTITLTTGKARELLIEYFEQKLTDTTTRWKGTSRTLATEMQDMGLLPYGTLNRGACIAIGKILSILTSQSNVRFFSDVIRHGQPRLFEVYRNPDIKKTGPIVPVNPFTNKPYEPVLERLAVESEHELIEFDKANKAFNVVSDKTAEEAAVPAAAQPATRRDMPPEKVAALLKLLPEPEEGTAS